jgi:penicillin-binding protein 1A
MGPITFRNALAHSRNVVTVKILEDIGVGYVLRFIKRLGDRITHQRISPLPGNFWRLHA